MSTAERTTATDADRDTVLAYLADRELPQVSGAYQRVLPDVPEEPKKGKKAKAAK